MRKLRSNRALSEIVGTLMLVLIVVSAATAFFAFVSSYEQQYEVAHQILVDKNLESIQITSLETGVANNTSGHALGRTTFVAVSTSPEWMNISGVLLNSDPLFNFSVSYTNGTNAPTGPYPSHRFTPFALAPGSRASVTAQLDPNETAYSGFYKEYFLNDVFLHLELYTERGNDFNRSFEAPTALITVSTTAEWNGTGALAIPLFSGTSSYVAANDSILQYRWARTGNVTATGAEVELFTGPPTGRSYNVTLVVVDEWGLSGTTIIAYTY